MLVMKIVCLSNIRYINDFFTIKFIIEIFFTMFFINLLVFSFSLKKNSTLSQVLKFKRKF
jgi:hypothetical protein